MIETSHVTFIGVACIAIGAVIGSLFTEGAGIGNDRVSVSDATVILVVDPSQLPSVMEILECQKPKAL